MPNDGSRPGGRSRTFAQGAASVVWAATLPNGGPTGTFTRDGRALPWLCGTSVSTVSFPTMATVNLA
jgi:hypothetical protein